MGASGLVWKETKDGDTWVATPPKLTVTPIFKWGDATMGGFAFAAAMGLSGKEAVRLATGVELQTRRRS